MVFGICITLALFAGASAIPVLGLLGVFVLPLPVLVYRLRLGRVRGAVVPAVAFAIMVMLFGGGSLDLFLFFALLLLGYILGESLERNFSLEKTVAVTCGGLTLAGLIILFFYSQAVGISIPDLISGYVAESLSVYQAAADKMGIAEEARQELATSLELIEYVARRTFPAIAVSGMLFTSLITLFLARPILKWVKLPYPDFEEFLLWKAPEMLVWVVIACGAFMLLPAGALKLIGENGLKIMMQVYFLQGIAIIAFLFKKKQVPQVIRWPLYTLLALVFNIFVVGLGFFDMWLNIRKLGADTGNSNEP